MSSSGDGGKPAQTGLVDMGNISFYNLAGVTPTFTLSDLASFTGAFSEMVLNVTWNELQPDGPNSLTTTAIDNAIAAVNSYNQQNNTHLGIKLRVWGGFTAPAWAQNIDGPPITITGQSSVDPGVFTPQTIGRFWSADYIAAWTNLQNQLAQRYDNNPTVFGISQTAGAAATDEPFVPMMTKAPISKGSSTTVNQVAELQAGGYTDQAEMLTLRAAISDYAQWSTTPLDYTMNLFHLFDSGGEQPDQNFTLAVLQQARNSTRVVQGGNHALRSPIYAPDSFVYVQLAADAMLDPNAAPASYQTASPDLLAGLPGSGTYPNFTGDFANWPDTVAAGVQFDAGDIELWDFSGPPGSGINGFLSLAPSQLQFLATLLAAGNPPPNAGAPDTGAPLGFVAPAFVTGAAGGPIAFTGTSAVLVASVTPKVGSVVVLSSTNGGSLSVTDIGGVVVGPSSGPSITLAGAPALVNAVLATLSDTLSGGSDIVHIEAIDNNGDKAVRDVGVQATAPAPSAPAPAPAPALPPFAGNGLLVVGGVQSKYAAGGTVTLSGSGGTATTLLAALASSAYSTATLGVGGLDVQSGGAARFTGSLIAPSITVASGGAIDGDGTLVVQGGGTITNNGTIEAAADLTLGLQRLDIPNPISGSGTLQIDPGATLTLGATLNAPQTVQFAANSIAQLANDPYSPGTLVIQSPVGWTAPINGFTFADSLVLANVAATGVTYTSPNLVVTTTTGSLTFNLPDPS
ncbi:MAG: hypothetical protein JOY64_22360, partial [Alphaproteobacteria bacterium]|nr:hypothetical protein [Alphaproteobacteria bacterium]